MEFIKNKRLLAIIGIVTLILGIFLPYLSISVLDYSHSINLWDYWEGKIILLLLIINVLFIFKDYIEKYLPQLFNSDIGKKIANIKDQRISLIPTVLVVVFVIYLNTRLDLDNEYIKYGIGFYLLWISVICLAAHAFIFKGNNTVGEVQQPTNNQNNNIEPTIETNNVEQNLNETPAKKFCSNCGTQVDGASFCPNCGNKIK